MSTVEVINGSGYPLAYSKDGDAGVDLRAMIGTERELLPGQRWPLRTGISVAIPAGHCGLVLPRSGLARDHGVVTVTGVIDAGYRGDIGVTLLNLGSQPYRLVPGERVAQLVIVPIARPIFVEVDALPDSERGASGFGSTGRG